jgi:hypothetical protein
MNPLDLLKTALIDNCYLLEKLASGPSGHKFLDFQKYG